MRAKLVQSIGFRVVYSIYHAARELGEIGYKEKVDHPNIVEFLGKVDPQLKESVGAFRDFAPKLTTTKL